MRFVVGWRADLAHKTLWTKSGVEVKFCRDPSATDANTAMRTLNLSVALVFSPVLLLAQPGFCQTSELYMLYSPNVINPVGTTYVYQAGHLLRSWMHASPYEISLVAAGGTVRQGAVFSGFSGTEYTTAGALTGTHYPAAPYVFDAASDGTSIYGWNVDTATLMRYDLNWSHPQVLFSLGPNSAYAYMGITYDPQNNSVWLAPWNTSIELRGHLYNYSLDGSLLGSLTLTGSSAMGSGLAYDPADGTFWMFNWGGNRLEQYSRGGSLLSTISGRARIYGLEFSAVPEPSVVALACSGALLYFARRFKKQQATSV